MQEYVAYLEILAKLQQSSKCDQVSSVRRNFPFIYNLWYYRNYITDITAVVLLNISIVVIRLLFTFSF